MLVLSGKDALVPGELVHKQLRDAPAFVHVLDHPALHHGHFLFRPQWQDTIIARYQSALREKECKGENGAAAATGAPAAQDGVG